MNALTLLLKELPSSVTIPVLATWLNTEDLSRLDVAICSKVQRVHYLRLLSEEGFTTYGITRVPRHLEDCYFRWLCSRRIKVRSVMIRDAKTYLIMTDERDLLPLCKRLSCLELSSHWFNRESASSLNPELMQRILDLISSCSHLQNLSVTNCDLITGSIVQLLAKSCPRLEKLDISYSSNIRGIELDADSSSRLIFEKLLSLDMSNSPRIKTSAIEEFVPRCKQLQKINLSGCLKLTDDVLLTILKQCKQLKHLNVRYCNQLTDNAILHIAEESRFSGNLQHLNFGGCLQITDAAVVDLVSAVGYNLETLEVVGCNKLTDISVMAIAEHCFFLKMLNLCNCSQITADAARAVLESCSVLQLLNINFCLKIYPNFAAEEGSARKRGVVILNERV